MNNAILSEKYTVKLIKESSLSISSGTSGGLFLTDYEVIFDPGNTFLSNFNNSTSGRFENWTTIPIKEINHIEIGSFKNLWKTIYTLRINLKSGEKYIFMMTSESAADKWLSEIKRLMQ